MTFEIYAIVCISFCVCFFVFLFFLVEQKRQDLYIVKSNTTNMADKGNMEFASFSFGSSKASDNSSSSGSSSRKRHHNENGNGSRRGGSHHHHGSVGLGGDDGDGDDDDDEGLFSDRHAR